MKYYNNNSVVFLDGRWTEASEAKASLYNQTMHYGYGVFDGMRSYRNADGCNIFKAKEHFDRLIDSASKLDIKIAYSSEELTHLAYKLLSKNNLRNAYIRPLIFLDPNMELVAGDDGHIFMAAWPWEKYLGHGPIEVMVSQYKRSTSQQLPQAKVVGGYTTSIMASTQAKRLGYHEALMLNEEGNIAEGPATNFFIEKDGVLCTPKSDYSLPGITRATVMFLARQWGLEVVEKDISLDEAYDADYAFFTGTAAELTPIGSINGESYKMKWENTQTHGLYLMYRQQVMFDEFQGLTIV